MSITVFKINFAMPKKYTKIYAKKFEKDPCTGGKEFCNFNETDFLNFYIME